MYATKVVYTAIRYFGDFYYVMKCSDESFCIAPGGVFLIFSKENPSATEIAKTFCLASHDSVNVAAKNWDC